MQIKFNSHESKILKWNDIATSIYIPLLLLILNYSGILLKIGNFDNIYIILILATLEVIKYIIFASKNKPLVRKNGTKDFLKSIIILFMILLIVYVVSVLFGAPAFSHFQETFMFSLLVTTVTALPSCLHLGPDNTLNLFFSLTSYEYEEAHKMCMFKIRLSLFGAWLGAFVIPLDWNRPWQNWPIPCFVGTLLGYTAANCFCSYLQIKQRGRSRKTGKYAL